MHRLLLAIVMLVVSGISGLGQIPPSVSAQSDPVTTDEALVDHPIVGTWRWDHDAANPDTLLAYSVFHADGTYEEVITGVGTVVGTWEATGMQTVEVTEVAHVLAGANLGHRGTFAVRGMRLVGESMVPFERPRCEAIGGLRCC